MTSRSRPREQIKTREFLFHSHSHSNFHFSFLKKTGGVYEFSRGAYDLLPAYNRTNTDKYSFDSISIRIAFPGPRGSNRKICHKSVHKGRQSCPNLGTIMAYHSAEIRQYVTSRPIWIGGGIKFQSLDVSRRDLLVKGTSAYIRIFEVLYRNTCSRRFIFSSETCIVMCKRDQYSPLDPLSVLMSS